jgi:hypothetical protein
MKLKNIMGARLTLDSGEELTLERLGKGQFHTCYVDVATRTTVFSVTIDRGALDADDHSKEILSKCDANVHIPRVGYAGAIEDRRVYTMPLYQPLRAREHPEAWALLQRLQQAREDAWTAILREQCVNHWNVAQRKMRLVDIGYLVNQRVCELMDAPGVPQSIKDALDELTRGAANYGSSYVFEFSKRNCLVSADGKTLILLDVLFNLEAVERIQTARQQRR